MIMPYLILSDSLIIEIDLEKIITCTYICCANIKELINEKTDL